MRKLAPKELIAFVILALLGAIIIGYVLICIFMMIIGVVAEDLHYFGYAFGMVACPIIVPTLVGDIKEWFF